MLFAARVRRQELKPRDERSPDSSGECPHRNRRVLNGNEAHGSSTCCAMPALHGRFQFERQGGVIGAPTLASGDDTVAFANERRRFYNARAQLYSNESTREFRYAV